MCVFRIAGKRFIELEKRIYDASSSFEKPTEQIDANKGSGQRAKVDYLPLWIVVGVHYVVSQPIGAKQLFTDIKICNRVVTNERTTPSPIIKIVALIHTGEKGFSKFTRTALERKGM